VTHLLVTNDFPPKIGGIQSYLYELWRRLPAERFGVLTIAHEGAEEFDAKQDFRIKRLDVAMLQPRREVQIAIESYAQEIGATHVVLDPVLPIGLIGPRLALSYSLVVHGAEIRIPGRLPVSRQLMRRAIAHAELIIAAGGYPAKETQRIAGHRTPPVVIVPPGVDVERFHPLDDIARTGAREKFGIDQDTLCVVSVSRLVPRKGMDVLIEASARLAKRYPKLCVLIGGTGRDHERLQGLITHYNAPVRLLGRIDDADLPSLYGCADIAAMLCRNRWFGLEQEGFGIVFLEAGAAGTVALAGDSGGASEAVLDHETGCVVKRPESVEAVAEALDELLRDDELRSRYAHAGRDRVVHHFDYDGLAKELDKALLGCETRT
jgi:phosphatidylinositol alpha-1,6-mannosyltransferase